MRSNFEFLEKSWGRLADLAEAAEQNASADPRACIMELGSFAEEVTKQILEAEGLTDPMNQVERIELLRERGAAPKLVIDILHQFRMRRNEAVHQNQDFSAAFAKKQLISARMLAQWFVRYFGGDPEAQAPEVPQNPSPVCPEQDIQPESGREEPVLRPEEPAPLPEQPDRKIVWLRIALGASLLLNAVQAIVWFCS